MKRKIEVEKRFLRDTEELLKELLKTHLSSNECKMDAFTKEKIKILVSRVINQEVEYLHEDPENYFDIYGEDHLKN